MPCTVCAHTHARRVCTHVQGVRMPVAVSPCPVSVGQHGRRLSFIGAAGTCPWAGVSPGGGPCAPPAIPHHSPGHPS